MKYVPTPRDHRIGKAALALAVSSALAIAAPGAIAKRLDQVAASTIPVTTCDDSGVGSLRDAVALSNNGDTVDLTALTCSTISLTTGAVDVEVDNLNFAGPGRTLLAVNGTQSGRIFSHAGSGVLSLSGLTLTNGRIVGADPTDFIRGGCINSNGTVSISDATVSNCVAESYTAAAGGCVAAYSVNLTDSTVSGCRAQSDGTEGWAGGDRAYGGGVYAYASVDIARSLVDNNVASAPHNRVWGGGVFVGYTYSNSSNRSTKGPSPSSFQASTITDSTISNNSALGSNYTIHQGSYAFPGGRGGGIHNKRPLIVSGSTIVGNFAQTGGGIWSGMRSTSPDQGRGNLLALTNSTVSGNTASIAGGGIGQVSYYYTILLSNSTVAFNTSVYAGGVMPQQSAFSFSDYGVRSEFESSIVANNITTGSYAAADVDVPLAENFNYVGIIGANNLIGSSGVPIPVDTISADPLLAPLANNGGPTLTHALGTGSPALDAGNNLAVVQYDQRGDGYPRSVGAAPDIGAFEFNDTVAIPAGERQALLDIYADTQGSSWTTSTGWRGDVGTECTWFGITCDAAGLHVISIDLSSNSLSGSLPASIVNLTSLATLVVSNNQLAGALPDFSGLADLQQFDASSNEITGNLPPIAALSNLVQFNVERNQLAGSLPDTLAGLTALKVFRVANNQLAGGPPDVPDAVTLTEGASSLCPNQLSHVPSSAWDAATGASPWYGDCVSTPTDVIFTDGFEELP